jgi:hypothetical protein
VFSISLDEELVSALGDIVTESLTVDDLLSELLALLHPTSKILDSNNKNITFLCIALPPLLCCTL